MSVALGREDFICPGNVLFHKYRYTHNIKHGTDNGPDCSFPNVISMFIKQHVSEIKGGNHLLYKYFPDLFYGGSRGTI